MRLVDRRDLNPPIGEVEHWGPSIRLRRWLAPQVQRPCPWLIVLALFLAAPAVAQAARYEGFAITGTSAPVPGDARYRELSYARRYGANVVRTTIAWSRMSDATYRANLTRYIRAEVSLGIHPILMLYTTENANHTVLGLPPSEPYAQAAAMAARLWGKDAAALEVWDEPNPIDGNEDQVARDYMDVLKPTYQAVKQAAPGLPVLAGAMAYADGRFLTDLYAHGLDDNMDGVSYHPYTFNMGPNDQSGGAEYSFKMGGPLLHQIMAANGDAGLELWITEMGWTIMPWKQYRAFYGPTLSRRQIVTDRRRARYMRRAAKIMRTWPWLACVDYYQLRDNHPPAMFYHGLPRTSYEWFINGFALLSRDWQATASLRMFAALNLRKAP